MASKFKFNKSTKPSLKFSTPVKYFIIAALVILIAFTVVYLYNIHTMSKKMEMFSDIVSSNNADNMPTTQVVSSKYADNMPTTQVVFLHMNRCGHCENFAPTWDKVSASKEWDNKIQFAKFEKSDEGAQQYLDKVNGFPTVLIVINGQVVDMSVGNSDEASLTAFINKNLQQ